MVFDKTKQLENNLLVLKDYVLEIKGHDCQIDDIDRMIDIVLRYISIVKLHGSNYDTYTINSRLKSYFVVLNNTFIFNKDKCKDQGKLNKLNSLKEFIDEYLNEY